MDALKETLQKVPELDSQDPRYEGRLKIPIGRMVVFPNISEADFRQRGLLGLIARERTLFRDDLDPAGEISKDTSGAKLRERIQGAFPFFFEGLTPKEVEKLASIIFPVIRIDLPERKGGGKDHFQATVRTLDQWQARAAMQLKRGHQIIKGPPGSGKTLVLVHRCCQLHRCDPRGRGAGF